MGWSNAKYKLTLGVGSLAVTGMLSELGRDVLPVWAALAIALLPLVVFVFVHPGELPARLVRIAHVAASVWYVLVAVGLLVALPTVQPLPRGWPVYPPFVAVGAVPCGIVLYRAARGRYQPPGTPEAAEAEPSGAADGGAGRLSGVRSSPVPRCDWAGSFGIRGRVGWRRRTRT